MKMNEIQPGGLFFFGPAPYRPQLKLKEGCLDIVSKWRPVYVCWNDRNVTLMTKTQIYKLRLVWRMTEETFKGFIRALIKRHSNDDEETATIKVL